MVPRETDEFRGVSTGPLPHLLAHQVAELSRIDSWRALRDLALDSGVIVLAAWFAETVINPLTYVLAVILIGVRFHALAVLMHDATHYRLFSSRGWNATGLAAVDHPVWVSQEPLRSSPSSQHRRGSRLGAEEERPIFCAAAGR